MAAGGPDASNGDVLARFSAEKAETDEESKALLAALVARYSAMEESRWPTIVREFNRRSAAERSAQWIKRAAGKLAKAGAGERRLLNVDSVHVGRSPIHGWGVFASQQVRKGDNVHVTPFRLLDLTTACAPAGIVKPDAEGVAIFQKVLPKEIHTDLFAGRTEMERALVLGLGSFFNHSDDPSVGYRLDYDEGTCRFFALRDCAAGEEMLISYGKTYFAERGMERA